MSYRRGIVKLAMNDDSRLGKGMYEVAVEAGVRRSVVVVAVVVRGVNGGGTKRGGRARGVCEREGERERLMPRTGAVER